MSSMNRLIKAVADVREVKTFQTSSQVLWCPCCGAICKCLVGEGRTRSEMDRKIGESQGAKRISITFHLHMCFPQGR